MNLRRIGKWLPVLALVPLAGIVLWTPYDPIVNRVAVSITLLVTSAGFFLFDRTLHRKTGLGLSFVPAWALALAAAEDAIGNMMYWYEAWVGYDDLGHVFGTFAIAMLFLEFFATLSSRRQWRLPNLHLSLYGLSMAMLVSVIYEISELVGDAFLGTYRITARLDSAMDLMWGLLGSGVAVMLWTTTHRRRSSPF